MTLHHGRGPDPADRHRAPALADRHRAPALADRHRAPAPADRALATERHMPRPHTPEATRAPEATVPAPADKNEELCP
ncbi:hypothetical protein [Streptomyces sp. NPDC088812]|uniref:hypothetical protein n=1 Tax=Streptomyces sp. NPDC088812 TaxID=3365905 RepID=UPI0037F1DCFE